MPVYAKTTVLKQTVLAKENKLLVQAHPVFMVHSQSYQVTKGDAEQNHSGRETIQKFTIALGKGVSHDTHSNTNTRHCMLHIQGCPHRDQGIPLASLASKVAVEKGTRVERESQIFQSNLPLVFILYSTHTMSASNTDKRLMAFVLW